MLTMFGPGNFCSEESKSIALSVEIVAKSGHKHFFWVVVAESQSLSSHSKGVPSTVSPLHRILQPKSKLTSTGFDPKY